MRQFILFSLFFSSLFFVIESTVFAEEIAPKTAQTSSKEIKSWWKQRDERSDIYYPHKAHYQTMEQEGDSCLLCHTFQKNTNHNEKQRKQINIIANEALEAICHDCHVTELRAPWRCDVCHDDPKTIWPADHNSGYIENHAEDSKQNDEICKTCHIDTKFCTDCHFRRDVAGKDYHRLGYRAKHGVDARLMPSNCGRCHNYFYCRECHEQSF